MRVIEPPHAPWGAPVDVYFRREGNAWKLVGVERTTAAGSNAEPRKRSN